MVVVCIPGRNLKSIKITYDKKRGWYRISFQSIVNGWRDECRNFATAQEALREAASMIDEGNGSVCVMIEN